MGRRAGHSFRPKPYALRYNPLHPGPFRPRRTPLKMLYPIDSETREVRDLSGIWDFCLDPEDLGEKENWGGGAWPVPFLGMPVPASYNDITTDARIRDHVGPVWYRRTFFCPEAWRTRQIRLRFGAVSHRAAVWLNGHPLCTHKGGFLPFEKEARSHLRFGAEGVNTLVVRVDNILDWTTLPPGEVAANPHTGTLRQAYFHDFFNFAGIHRPVRLVVLPDGGIEEIATRIARSDDGGARLSVAVDATAPVCRLTLRDAEGAIVASGTGHRTELSVCIPRWWSPDSPHLYELVVEACDADGSLRDVYRLPVGLRTVRVDGDRFLLNEQPFYFRGFGKHEDADIRGKGLDDVTNQRDFNLLKWIGANSVRTSHYPYAEEFLRMADREGIAVIGECPAVGLYRFEEQDNPTTPIFTPERAGAELRRHHLDTVRDMIMRDRNHASILMWSLGNETATHEEAGRRHFDEVATLARALDPSRPLTIVECNYPRHSKIGDLVDVISINRYYGWYLDSGELDTISQRFRAELEEWRRRWARPIFLAEYGADTLAGLHKLPSGMFSEEFQIEFIEAFNRVLDTCPYIVGEHIWGFADFATKQGITRIDGNRKGVFTRQRQPKAIAHFLRQRWTSVQTSRRDCTVAPDATRQTSSTHIV